jgi:hypothetical protein
LLPYCPGPGAGNAANLLASSVTRMWLSWFCRISGPLLLSYSSPLHQSTSPRGYGNKAPHLADISTWLCFIYGLWWMVRCQFNGIGPLDTLLVSFSKMAILDAGQ